VSRLLGRDVPLAEVRSKLVARFAEVFERTVESHGVDTHSVQVWLWRRGANGPEVLLLKRTERDGAFWQPVTGLLDPGETPADAAAREVAEETGVTGVPESLEFVRDFRVVPAGWAPKPVAGARPWLNREHAYAMEAGDARIALSADEHEEYLWMHPEQAKELLRWNGNRRSLERLVVRMRERTPLSS
jgi:lipoyl(octanoyl) transferase